MSLRGFESLSLRQVSNTNSLILRPWLADRDPDHPGLVIDALPGEPESLTLAQTELQGDGTQPFQRIAVQRLQGPSRLLGVKDGVLVRLHLWCVRQSSRVPAD